MSLGARSKRKGHNLERLVTSIFRDVLGYKNATTTRYASKLLDDCSIDIALNGPKLDLDYYIQCKAGYKKNRPKYEEIYNKIRTECNC